jgi:hypothetical protein
LLKVWLHTWELLPHLHARPPWRKAVVVERRRRVVVEEAAMFAGARRRRAGLLLRVEVSSRKQWPMLGKEEATSRKEETVPSKKVEVRRGRAVATSTTSCRGSVVEVRGWAAVPSKVEEASMQVEHARWSVAQSLREKANAAAWHVEWEKNKIVDMTSKNTDPCVTISRLLIDLT